MATLTGLITRIRDEFLDDTLGVIGGDSLWSDGDITSALNWSEATMCRRLHLLKDSTTDSICNIEVVSGQRDYAISPKIVRIERMKYPGVIKPLPRGTVEEMDRIYGDWSTLKGEPSAFTLGMGVDLLTLNREPANNDGVMNLLVSRLPLVQLAVASPTASPELSNYDDELCHGALSRLYLKDDHQTYDPARAGMWTRLFNDDIARIMDNQEQSSGHIGSSLPGKWS